MMKPGNSALSLVAALIFLLPALLPAELPAAEGTKPGTVFSDCPDCPEVVVIPAGNSVMGVPGDPYCVPVHPVSLKYPFALGRTEVTEAQFRFFLRRTGYNAGAEHLKVPFSPQRPAVDLDWYAATAYLRWLSRYTGHSYRLPSETEWDYAAHAGRSTRYWWGDLVTDGCGKEHLWASYLPYDQPCAASQEQGVINVASLAANPWGLYDTQGNAGEWMQDCITVSSTYAGVPVDGAPYEGHSSCSHVVRGPDLGLNHGSNDPRDHQPGIGFRVLRELP